MYIRIMKVRKGSINYLILLALEKTIDGVVRLDDITNNSYKYLGGVNEVKKTNLSLSIRRLRSAGYIEKQTLDEGKIIIKLTELGKGYLGIEEEWDGKYRIIVWDIPENKRKVRDLLRGKVKIG